MTGVTIGIMNSIPPMADRSTMSHADEAPLAPRGVSSIEEAERWLADRRIEDIECITPDLAGVPRGKMMPTRKFLSNARLALPGSIFMQTISGDYPEETEHFQYQPHDGDFKLQPDLATLAAVPWESDPTAQVICDLVDVDGEPVGLSPRNVLKRVLDAYAADGLEAVIAPEIEFYLVKPNPDPDYPLEPPVGRSGRAISGGQSYSIAGVNEFDELIDDIYDFSEAQGLEIDTLIHEEGAAQLEINLRHGEPMRLADEVFLFKRTLREAALKHDMYATFMAKPIAGQPGSAMHIHQSVIEAETSRNVFSNPDGSESQRFLNFIAGQQAYLPKSMSLLAPYVNSYRRLTRNISAPVNVHWGYDNRTTGLRIPISGPEARRVENRLPSSDVNPYLAIATSLACGLLGIRQKLEPKPAVATAANEGDIDLPRGLLDAVALLEDCAPLADLLGHEFVATYCAVKHGEFETFMEVISSWEREFLLLNV